MAFTHGLTCPSRVFADSGNLREEIPWYIHRMEGGWQWVALLLLLFSFVVPFLLLLNGDVKSNPKFLAYVALLVLATRFVELIYLVKPAFSPAHFQLHWLDAATIVGVGGIWLAFFTRQVRSMPILPLHDPRLAEESNHHE